MAKSTLQCDLLIVGGGPAGSTLGTLVKKYNPSARVVIAEMERFPRHHIGESLLPAVPPILREMGVFEKVDTAGFPKKLGGSYVWGATRKPWVVDFADLTFEQQLAMGWKPNDPLAYCWQVHRSRYDEILLRHARECGVEVLQGRAVGITEEGARITGAVISVDGKDVAVRSRLLADCSGQNGFLSQHRSIRRFDERLRNVAMYSYFKGAEWHTRFVGHPDKTRTFLCSVEGGWFWYIPIGPDLISVGLVTTHDHLQARKIKDLRAFYESKIAGCAEVSKLLKNAAVQGDFDGTGKDFFVVKDWSYLCDEAAGPGWLAAGDAAVFVDPVFSSGATIAHLSAQRAAYTITKAWKDGVSPALERALWRDYSAFARDCAAAFLIMALYWYKNDRSQRGLWKKAAELYQARLPQSLSDFNAYLAVISGVLAPAERLLGFDLDKPRSEDFVKGICDVKTRGEIAALSRRVVADGAIPRLTCPFSVELSFLPDPQIGSLKEAVRVRFAKHAETDYLSGVLNPRLVASPIRLELIRSFDGVRTLRRIKEDLAAHHKIDRRSADIEAAGLLRQLMLWKVVELVKPAAKSARRKKRVPAGR